MSENVLHIENVTMQFGGVVAVNNLTLDVGRGEIVALIGPNGAGKTTAFNCVTGVYEPTNGRVDFLGRPMVENYPQGKMEKIYKGEHAGAYTHVLAPTPDKITKLGMARTFQNIRLWKSQSVFDNVLIAMHCRTHTNFLAASFRLNRRDTSQTLREGVELQFVPPAHYTQGDLVEVEGQPLELAYTGSAVQPQTGAWLAGRPCKLCLSSGGGLNR